MELRKKFIQNEPSIILQKLIKNSLYNKINLHPIIPFTNGFITDEVRNNMNFNSFDEVFDYLVLKFKVFFTELTKMNYFYKLKKLHPLINFLNNIYNLNIVEGNFRQFIFKSIDLSNKIRDVDKSKDEIEKLRLKKIWKIVIANDLLKKNSELTEETIKKIITPKEFKEFESFSEHMANIIIHHLKQVHMYNNNYFKTQYKPQLFMPKILKNQPIFNFPLIRSDISMEKNDSGQIVFYGGEYEKIRRYFRLWPNRNFLLTKDEYDNKTKSNILLYQKYLKKNDIKNYYKINEFQGTDKLTLQLHSNIKNPKAKTTNVELIKGEDNFFNEKNIINIIKDKSHSFNKNLIEIMTYVNNNSEKKQIEEDEKEIKITSKNDNLIDYNHENISINLLNKKNNEINAIFYLNTLIFINHFYQINDEEFFKRDFNFNNFNLDDNYFEFRKLKKSGISIVKLKLATLPSLLCLIEIVAGIFGKELPNTFNSYFEMGRLIYSWFNFDINDYIFSDLNPYVLIVKKLDSKFIIKMAKLAFIFKHSDEKPQAEDLLFNIQELTNIEQFKNHSIQKLYDSEYDYLDLFAFKLSENNDNNIRYLYKYDIKYNNKDIIPPAYTSSFVYGKKKSIIKLYNANVKVIYDNYILNDKFIENSNITNEIINIFLKKISNSNIIGAIVYDEKTIILCKIRFGNKFIYYSANSLRIIKFKNDNVILTNLVFSNLYPTICKSNEVKETITIFTYYPFVIDKNIDEILKNNYIKDNDTNYCLMLINTNNNFIISLLKKKKFMIHMTIKIQIFCLTL